MNPETECPRLDCPKDKFIHIHGECCPICEGKKECPRLDCLKDKFIHIHGECCPICEGKTEVS